MYLNSPMYSKWLVNPEGLTLTLDVFKYKKKDSY